MGRISYLFYNSLLKKMIFQVLLQKDWQESFLCGRYVYVHFCAKFCYILLSIYILYDFSMHLIFICEHSRDIHTITEPRISMILKI